MEKEVIIGNNLSEIVHITNFIGEMGTLLQLSAEVVMSISLVLEEAIANVVTHSYPLGGEHEISLKMNVSSQELSFILTDDGVSFENLSVDNLESSHSWNRLGMRLIYQIMDEVSYQCAGDLNHLTMKKKISINMEKEKTMKTNICKVDGITIVIVEGRLDTINAPEFETVMRPLQELKDSVIVINCENLLYLSSSGIRCFILLQKSVLKNGGQLILEAVKPQIHKIFDMTGCTSIFTIR